MTRNRQQPPEHPRCRTTGFTLIELLVVISIIAMLIAILLPSLHRARKSVRTVQCLSNLRSMAMASNIYAADWNSHLPTYYGDGSSDDSGYIGSWAHRIYSYLDRNSKLYLCPDYSDYPMRHVTDPLYSAFGMTGAFQMDTRYTLSAASTAAVFAGDPRIGLTYGMVQNGLNQVQPSNLATYPYPKLDTLEKAGYIKFAKGPSTWAMLAETRHQKTYAYVLSPYAHAANSTTWTNYVASVRNSNGANAPWVGTSPVFSTVHNDATNVPFADGHVTTYSAEPMLSANFSAPGFSRAATYPF